MKTDVGTVGTGGIWAGGTRRPPTAAIGSRTTIAASLRLRRRIVRRPRIGLRLRPRTGRRRRRTLMTARADVLRLLGRRISPPADRRAAPLRDLPTGDRARVRRMARDTEGRAVLDGRDKA